jgi:hypothetical protein
MMAMKRNWITVGSLLVGVFCGVAGAEVLEKARRFRSIDTGLFALKADDRASIFVTLNDKTVNGPATVRLQFLDQAGSTVLSQDVMLQPGQSTRLSTTGAAAGTAFLRARAEVVDDALQLASAPAVLGTVEVLNLTTLQRGPVCTVHDYGGDGQRQ